MPKRLPATLVTPQRRGAVRRLRAEGRRALQEKAAGAKREYHRHFYASQFISIFSRALAAIPIEIIILSAISPFFPAHSQVFTHALFAMPIARCFFAFYLLGADNAAASSTSFDIIIYQAWSIAAHMRADFNTAYLNSHCCTPAHLK